MTDQDGQTAHHVAKAPPTESARRPTCVLILGMHRSGTSALTRVVNLLGVGLPKKIMGARDGNEAGHWEPERLVSLHDKMLSELGSAWHDWRHLDMSGLSQVRRAEIKAEIRRTVEEEYAGEDLFIIKDPRICRFATFFIDTLEEAGIDVVPVVTLRNPLEVLASLEKRTSEWPAGFSNADAAMLWLSHVLEAERATRHRARAIVTYGDLMADWRKVADAITSQTGLDLNAASHEAAPAINAFLTDNLRHHSRDFGEVAQDPVTKDWISEAYRAMIALAEDTENRQVEAVLDELSSNLKRSEAVLYNMMLSGRRSQLAALSLAEAAEAELSEMRAQTGARISALEKALTERDRHLIRLQDDYDDTVSAFHASTSWRLTAPLRASKLTIEGLRKAGATVSKTVKAGGGVGPTSARSLRVLFREGPKGVVGRLKNLDRITSLAHVGGGVPLRSGPRPATRQRIEAIRFDIYPDPEVSIVVPVYNQLDYTVQCLESLMAIDASYDFEVIVMDDGSSDGSEAVLSDIPGLRYVRNEGNLGFLRNCNKGASLARGRYLVFLNNDTELDPNWLTALRRTFDQHENVGLVGSKLVYPDGRLQEAGGIVWNDASAWNWGRLKDPAHPAYNYVRDVDYISGASIMVRRDVFERLNCFDERYENAYYEDTDLAMSVRDAGMRVIYQPASVVIHYEGISSGVDETTGVKRYQIVNREIFRDKWEKALKDNLPNGTAPEVASDRCVRGHILVVDGCTPTPDQDSGSVDMFNLIRILRGEGYRVHFIPQSNFAYFGAYTEALKALGVECIYAPFYRSVDEFLAERGDMFDYAILTRVNVADKSIAAVERYCPRAQKVFYTVDLHFLREKREAKLSGDKAKLAAAARTERTELSLMDRVDTTIVLSEVEREYLQKLGKPNIAVLPLIRDLREAVKLPFEKRTGVLFIGGYRHTPNVDAVDWLVGEIWPLVRRLTEERGLDPITLHLYGAEMPERFRKHAAADIKIHGFVDDLAVAFSKVRLSVAPLRYGAGLKGKLAASFEYGVPAVGTDVAFEGVDAPEFERLRVPADAAERLAERLVDLHTDEAAWRYLSDRVRRYAEEHYSIVAAREKLKAVLKIAECGK